MITQPEKQDAKPAGYTGPYPMCPRCREPITDGSHIGSIGYTTAVGAALVMFFHKPPKGNCGNPLPILVMGGDMLNDAGGSMVKLS